ncbi:MAG: hypothetical protein V1866_03595 [archaeon]
MTLAEAKRQFILVGHSTFRISLPSDACSIGLRIAPYFPDQNNRAMYGFKYSLAILSAAEPFIIKVERGPKYNDPYLNALEGENSHYILSSILNLYDGLRNNRFEPSEKVLLKDEEITGLVELTRSVADNRQRLEQMLTIPVLKKTIQAPKNFWGVMWTVPDYIGQQARAMS